MNFLSKQQNEFIKNSIDQHLGFEKNRTYSYVEETKIKEVIRRFCEIFKQEVNTPKVSDDYLDFLVICACADSVK
jgi:hypothetical protein